MSGDTVPLPDVGSRSTGDIQAVARTAQILALFGPSRPTLTVAQGATLLGLNRTTTNRYFMSLVAAELLERCPDQQASFQPSRLLYQLGAFALGRQQVTEIAPPVMRDLSADAHLTVAMALWGAGGPVVVHVEQHVTWGAAVTVRVGHQLASDAAQTQVFLAFHPDRFAIERLLGTVPGAQREDLNERAEQARASGIGSTTTSAGVRILAAPVFGARGLAATIAVIGTATALAPGSAAREESLLTAAAMRLTDLMGGTWPLPVPDAVAGPESGTA
ncbi:MULTISPECIES: IclR family transcriptional regulator [unclassified Pseudonocardia]|uniref:IclR family transcriptional regulator n=1 Tax=unclassified Pseudonocardia TaxID=2619320 RepID=UPI001CF6A918|nr:helix-turn-helix domain-containing protein [Pseudonocardia sp. ICBG601]